MALTLETTLRNTLADAIDTAVGSAGYLEFQTSGDVEVATITFSNPAFGNAATGQIVLGSTTDDTNAAGGTAAKFAIYNGTGPTKLLTGTVTATGGGGDITITSTSIDAGTTVSLTSFSITVPAS